MANNITPQIVTVNAQVEQGAQPSTLQQTGAIVSFGATTLAAGSSAYVGTLAAGQAILEAPSAISTLDSSSGTVTATVSGSLDLATGETFTTTISGAVPAAFNGTFVATVASSTTFTVENSAVTGDATSGGTYTRPGVANVNAALTSFFAQGSAVGVMVAEIGPESSWASAVTALGTFVTNDHAAPQSIYAYLIDPDAVNGDPSGVSSLAGDYSSPSGKTYFIVPVSATNLASLGTSKSLIAVVPSSGQGATESQAAAVLYNWVENNPGTVNGLAPMSYRFLYGMTPWQLAGNAGTVNTVLSGFGNLVLTGAQGGITNAVLFRGTTLDGSQAASWYGIDWCQIQAAQRLAAAIINGSNTTNPLLYDQNGINTLQAIAQSVMSDAVAYGCLESATVTATPFQQYVTANPANYAAGVYDGLAATVTAQNGFLTITFSLSAVTFQ